MHSSPDMLLCCMRVNTYCTDKATATSITPQVGLEPTTFGLEVQRAIHCATRASITPYTHHHHMHDASQTDLTHSLHTLVHRLFERHRAVLTSMASAYISQRYHARGRQASEYSLHEQPARFSLLHRKNSMYTAMSISIYQPWALEKIFPQHTPGGTQTHNLWIRSPTRYPLRH